MHREVIVGQDRRGRGGETEKRESEESERYLTGQAD